MNPDWFVTLMGFLPPVVLAVGVVLYLAFDAWVLHRNDGPRYEDDLPTGSGYTGEREEGEHVRRVRKRRRPSS